MTRFPLAWPPGWRRIMPGLRVDAPFSQRKQPLSINAGTERVMKELYAMGISKDDVIISSNLKVRLDGLPISQQSQPADPGIAVYWKKPKDVQHKVMATDRYTKVADNLAAVAATLYAMRAIERHGGAVILERAFTGFQCLPAPNTWRAVLGYVEDDQPTMEEVSQSYKRLSKRHHPDAGGTEAKMSELNWAMAEAEKELS